MLATGARDGGFDYRGATGQEKKRLSAYLANLGDANPAGMNADEKKALYINAYNATAISIVLDRYPIRSIREVDGAFQKIRRKIERKRRSTDMTDRAEIETRVRKVLAEQLAVDEAQVVPDARFAEDLNADSLDLVEAVLALEEEWDIEIPEDEMEQIKTVGAAVDMVATKLGVS